MAGGFARPDFANSITAFHPECERTDAREHLALFPMYTPNASGDTRFSMTVGLVCGALVIPLSWIGIERLHLGLYSVPMGWIAAWSTRALLTQWKLRDGAWMRRAPLAAKELVAAGFP